MKLLASWIKMGYILIWAAVFAQGPQFIHQYLNHLEGHYQELRTQDSLLKKMMEEDDLRLLAEKIRKADGFYAVKQSEFILHLVDRKETFESTIRSLKTSSPWTLPFFFIRYFDSSIGKETVGSFYFGLPATLDGLIYMVIGALFGLLTWAAFGSLFKKKPQVKTEESA